MILNEKPTALTFLDPQMTKNKKLIITLGFAAPFTPPVNEDSPLYIPENLYGTSVEQSKKHCTQ